MSLPGKATLSSYGGILQDAVPQIDPETEISADSLNQCRLDVASMTRVSEIARLQFLGSASDPTLNSSSTWSVGFDSVWGNSVVADRPTAVHTSTGVITWTFPVSIEDELGNTVLINLRGGTAQVADAALSFAQVKITSSNTCVVYLFNAAGSANDLVGKNIIVSLF